MTTKQRTKAKEASGASPAFGQAKLTIRSSRDKFEQDADRVGDEVVRVLHKTVWRDKEKGPKRRILQAQTVPEHVKLSLRRQVEQDKGQKGIHRPKPELRGNHTIVAKARYRANGDIGKAYDWTPGWWYSRNKSLPGWRNRPKKYEENQGAKNPPPSGEGICNWGDGQPTCNVFAYDVLYDSGMEPPVRKDNKHYYSASETYKRKADLRTYFDIIADPQSVRPGDIMATGGHVEIVTSTISKNRFRSIGAHVDGAYETDKTYLKGMRFLRATKQQENTKKEKKQNIQRRESSGNTSEVTPELESEIKALTGSGQPLGEIVRTFFQPFFGYDIGRIRIHVGTPASEIAQTVSAKAFTVGRDIFFASSQYQPQTKEGKRLLAHELTHVLQQCGGYLRPTSMIQRWGSGVHEKLTREGVEEVFSGYPRFKMNREALSNLAEHSTRMDFKPAEIACNAKGASIAAQAGCGKTIFTPYRHPLLRRPVAPRLTDEERHAALVSHYSANPAHAKNHGEGGLYDTSKSSGAAVNERHHEKYEIQARKEFNKLNWRFSSQKECEETKSKARMDVLPLLGDALHIAQDRGSHREGARGWGHDSCNYDCDDPAQNRVGLAEAIENTWNVLSRASDFLLPVLDRFCRWQFEQPAQVRIKYVQPGSTNR